MTRMILFSILSCLTMISCLQQTEDQNNLDYKKFIDYEFYGEIHNEYLDFAKNEYPEHKIFSLPENERFLKKTEILADFTHTNSKLANIKMFQSAEENEKRVSMLSYPDLFDKYGELVMNDLDNLAESQSISLEDKVLINELLLFITNEAESYDEIVIKIDELIEQWESYQFELGTVDGELSAAVLSIAKHSFNYWNNNYEALKNIHNFESLPRIWWFVARIALKDAFSGLVGTGVVAIVEGLIKGEAQHWDGEDFAINFISSAVMGSIGL